MSRRPSTKSAGGLSLPAPVGSAAGAGSQPLPPEVRRGQRWRSLAICLGLALAVWEVYGRTFHYDFVNYDDNLYVYDNPVVEKGLAWEGFRWAFTHSLVENWHPLTVLSYMADAQCHGLKPGGYHLTNVALHTVAVILLFAALKEMTGALWRSAFVAAVFAIHPLHVESVAWVSERKDVLSGVFFMLTLWAYVTAVARDKGQVTGTSIAPASFLSRVTCHLSPFYWLALLFFALGLMAKPMLVTLPFVLLLLDYWPLQRFTSKAFGVRRLLVEKLPFFILSAAACVATLVTQKEVIVRPPLSLRLENAVMSCAIYLGQMFWPAGLAASYPYPEQGLPPGKVALAFGLLVLVSAGAFLWRRRRPWLLAGWLWYLGMLVPVMGLVQSGLRAHGDRYTYLPQIGLYILAAWGVAELCGSWRHRGAVLGCTAALIFTALLATARVQTGYWRDSVSLWKHTLTSTSGNYIAEHNLGVALAARQEWTDAILHYQRALELKPDYVDAHLNLGVALAAQGQCTEAAQHYQRALQLAPDDAEAHYDWALALDDQGMSAQAVPEYERAIQLKPDYAKACDSLGVALANQGRLAEAEQAFDRALQFQPNLAKAHYNLALTFTTQGRWAEAIGHFERAIQCQPGYARAHYDLGNALVHEGKPAEARSHFQQALDLATAQGNAALTETARARLQSYSPAPPSPQTP